MVNPVVMYIIATFQPNKPASVLLAGLFGWKVAIIYITNGLTIAILSGWLIGKFKMEKYVAEWVYTVKVGQTGEFEEHITFYERIQKGVESVKEIVGKIWIYILIGIAA